MKINFDCPKLPFCGCGMAFYAVSLCFFLYAAGNQRERSFLGQFRPVFTAFQVNDL
jgi:hypothetical protein